MMPNPWILLAFVIALGGVYIKGRSDGIDLQAATQLRDEQIAQTSRDAALIVTAEAIAKIQVKNTTIKQTLEKEIHEKTYYADCKHDATGMRLINAALTGQTESASDSKLPRLDAITGQ